MVGQEEHEPEREEHEALTTSPEAGHVDASRQ
jgi:hypothetical protein